MATDTTQRDPITKFQDLLRELFQFDCADLDFGIYRIMNHKRDAVETFITQRLPAAVGSELSKGGLAVEAQATAELAEAAQAVRDNINDNAIDAAGVLAEQHHGTRAGQRYLEAQARSHEGSRTRESIETAIYNHLYQFFSRYYEDGDFISKRRYGRNQRYAIPYNGEEVYLHWANSDQYYVKTDEHFRDYDWTAPSGVSVRFRIASADVEQDNVKGDRRFFLPRVDETTWDADTRTVTVPFEYRPLNGAESTRYGNRNQQDKINAEAASAIPQALDAPDAPADALEALTGLHRPDDTDPVARLEHHLRRYARKNDSDFFIHKDLSAFLTRELDFFLKNEVLSVDDLLAAGERMAEGRFQQLKLIRDVGVQIIDFLSQIEDFQKMLWEKRKFVTEAHYCVTLSQVKEEFYPDIAATGAQWDEWRDLLGVDDSDRSDDFLRDNSTLVLDTRHFRTDFTDRLLASFDDLDGMTDGLLVHSENWQALRLLEEKYRSGVKCVHIDPPYNTPTSGFLYKNGYQHSSWLAMMRDRVSLGENLLGDDGSLLCHIDDNEYERLHLALEGLPVPSIGTIVWDKRNPMTGGGGIATQHEYITIRSWSSEALRLRGVGSQMMSDEADRLISRDGGVTHKTRSDYSRWISKNDSLSGGEKAYRYIDDAGRVYRGVSLRAPEPRTDPKFFVPLVHPATGKPCAVPPNGFSRTPETLQSMMDRGRFYSAVTKQLNHNRRGS